MDTVMDTMGIIWLALYGAILIVAIWQQLKSSSATKSHNKQKHDNDNSCHINSVSKFKQGFSSIIASSVSDAVDDNCGKDAKNCHTDNSYPHSVSITRDRESSQSLQTKGRDGQSE
jgi:hypothetical protein